MLIQALISVCDAPPAGDVAKFAHTSQSPGVSRSDVMSAVTPLVRTTPVAEFEMNSPTTPAPGGFPFDVPGICPATPVKSPVRIVLKVGFAFPPEEGPARNVSGACGSKLAPETMIPEPPPVTLCRLRK